MHPLIVSFLMLSAVAGTFLLSGALIALAGRQPQPAEAPKGISPQA